VKALVIIEMQSWMFRTPDRMAQVTGLLLDAAQRRYEVTFVEDAIGHTEAHLREPLFDWLVND
jgi:hypothetical protein